MSTVTKEPPAGSGADFDVDRHDSLGLRIQHVLHGNPVLGPLAVLVLAIIAFSLFNSRFFSAANLSLVLAQVTAQEKAADRAFRIPLSRRRVSPGHRAADGPVPQNANLF